MYSLHASQHEHPLSEFEKYSPPIDKSNDNSFGSSHNNSP